MTMKERLKKLVEVTGPSGYERAVREIVMAEIDGLADEVKVDALGNLIARKGKKGTKGKSVMLAAHLDEIGIMVTHVDERGFARFTTIGGVWNYNLSGGRVRFINGAQGVFGMEPTSSRMTVANIENFYVDFGVDSARDCPVQIGDVGAFQRAFEEVAGRWVSKAMDNRIGVLTVIETLRRLKDGPNEIVAVFTTQEEVGVRGATAAAFGIEPDLGIAIDVTKTGDTPQAETMEVTLGKGPAIKIKDTGMIADPRVVSWMESAAKRIRIPYQFEVLIGGSTDARAIQLSRGGVPAGCISIPCRYIHSPSEMVDPGDVENAIKLLTHLVEREIKL
jgi:endoglucanase